ncbi:hypothetical protein E4U41_005925 [Claviceps citrina]|nr:hypothetical protein E4U41_005925 [Claviceps citrina]
MLQRRVGMRLGPARLMTATALLLLLLLLTTYKLRQTWPVVGRRARTEPRSNNVYAFYAHSDEYACSVLVNAHILRHDFHTRHRIVAMLSDGVSPAMRDALAAQDIVVVPDTPLALHRNSIQYYQGCLLKLAAFKLHLFDPSIERVLVLDADQLILQDLDPVFDASPLEAPFLAPTAYWIGNRTVSSTCMLIRPSTASWDRIVAAAANMTSDDYDMDLVNRLFVADEGEVRLKSKFATLNSHWEDWNVPAWFERPERPESPRSDAAADADADAGVKVTSRDLHALQDQTAIVHFTAVQKPWKFDTAELQRERPNAHPLLAQQWMTWRSLAMQECPAGTLSGGL